MDIMTAVFCLSIAFGSFKIVEGLEIAPSSEPGFGKFYHAGSNLTISCSEKNLIHLNWMKDTSDLSVCSIDQEPYCLPGTRYTYENESFNLILINMKVKDCGQYKCITNTGSKSFDLHLIDFVKAIDVLEHSNDITMTTNCVLSANTVNVQWFFIDGDGSAVAYNKLAKRSELQGNCTEACWEDKALKVKSTLELPSKVKNPIKVKLMAYVEQGGKIMTRTSSNIFTIEGCAPPTKNGVIAAICIAVIFILGDLMYIIYSCPLRCQQRNDGKAVEPPLLPASDVNGASISKTHVENGYVSRWMVDVFPAIVVSSIVCIFSIILFLLKHETKIPDLDGNCADVHVNNITMVVVIAFVIITISVNWKIIWIIVKKLVWKRVKTNKSIEADVELTPQLNEPMSADVELTPQLNEPMSDSPNGKMSFSCIPLTVNEVLINLGGKGKLACTLDSDDYPSWTCPGGNVINECGKEEIKHEYQGHISWDADKRSIIISDVNVSHAGTFVCLNKGKVQKLNLVVILPTEKIQARVDETVHLDPGKSLSGTRRVWKRITTIVQELFNTVHDERIEIRDDEYGIRIRNCQIGDTGLYEVVENNVIKRFDVRINNIKHDVCTDESSVEEDQTIELQSSSKEKYPSWECVESGVFNYGGKKDFILVNPDTSNLSHLKWSDDETSLVIMNIRKKHTGTYICRHANGFVETVTVNVKGKADGFGPPTPKKTKGKIKHRHTLR